MANHRGRRGNQPALLCALCALCDTKVQFLRAIRRKRDTYERKASRGRAKPQRAQRKAYRFSSVFSMPSMVSTSPIFVFALVPATLACG
jgi:hypothetical protein